MDDLADRAARVAHRHPAAVLPFHELLRLVRDSGVVVSDDLLLHSLARHPRRFRIIDPWRGPWRDLDPRRVRPRTGDAGSADTLGGEEGLPPGPWIVAEPAPEPWSPQGGRLALRRLRQTLVHLAWALDERSGRELARWCALVGEAGRVRPLLERAERA